MNEDLVEVRVPTYERPQLLKRALECLRRQTWPNWKAIVFDDSSTSEASAIVGQLGDRRIEIRKNPTHLGAAGNLDQCFGPGPIAGGRFAFVLEDDNGVRPQFIEANLMALRKHRVGLLLREQEILAQTVSEWIPMGLRTKARLYPRSGLYPELYVRSSIFFNDTVANGGLFWDITKLRSNLVVGEHVHDSGLQEYCRTVQIAEAILFCAEPLGLWTRAQMSRPARSFVADRLFGRAIQSLQTHLLDFYGGELKASLWRTARSLQLEHTLRNTFANLAAPRHSILLRHNLKTLRLITKGLLRKIFAPNDLSCYLENLTLEPAKLTNQSSPVQTEVCGTAD